MKATQPLFLFLLCISIQLPAMGKGVDFPTFGVKLNPPRGWSRVPAGGPSQVARYARLADGGTRAKDVVVLELVQLKQGLSPYLYAKSMAKKLGGKINKEVQMGNLPAVEVRANVGSKGKMTARQLRIVAHQGHLWILSYWSAGRGGYAQKTITAMSNSMSWSTFAHPSKHLEISDKPTLLLNKSIKARLPEITRPIPMKAKGSARYGIHNHSRNSAEWMLQVKINDGDPPEDMEAAKTVFARQIGKKFPEISKLEWKDAKVKGAEASILLPVTLKVEAGKPAGNEYQYLLVLKGARLYVLSFSITSSEAAAFPSYRTLVDKIVRTIEVSDPPP